MCWKEKVKKRVNITDSQKLWKPDNVTHSHSAQGNSELKFICIVNRKDGVFFTIKKA